MARGFRIGSKFEMEPFADVAEAKTWLRSKLGSAAAQSARSA
jgi:hypothetical protein